MPSDSKRAKNERCATGALPKPEVPNILVTGTPGTGKTTLGARLCERLALRHIEVGSFASELGLTLERDPRFDCLVLDEEKVLDMLEPELVQGGVVLDYHSCDWFPERWIDLAVVLRCNTETLYQRLEARGYAGSKLENNMECEIMCVLSAETRESYPRARILELFSDTVAQLESNVDTVASAYQGMRVQRALK